MTDCHIDSLLATDSLLAPDALLTLAAAARQQAPRGKPTLPPCGIAARFANGTVLATAGLAFNTVMAAGAAQRLLHTFLKTYPDAPPRIAAAAAVGAAGEPPCTLADLLTLAAFADPAAALLCHSGDDLPTPTPTSPITGMSITHLAITNLAITNLAITNLAGRFTHLPRPATSFAPRYTLHAIGTGGTRTGHTVPLMGYWPAFQLTICSDPTDLTAVRAMLADLMTAYADWHLERLVITGTVPDDSFPLSGRDLQALRRAMPGTLPIQWPGGEATLDALMPGAYQSNYTRFQTPPDMPCWHETPATTLAARLGAEHFHHTVAAVTAFASTAPVQPPRVAGVLLETGDVICAGHLPLHGVNVPSCAETHALRRVLQQPQARLRALFLHIHENHTDDPLLGVQAAPCGFCREHIAALCPPDMPVILMNGRGRFQTAAAGQLLAAGAENRGQG
jgi:cytidine deaminase